MEMGGVLMAISGALIKAEEVLNVVGGVLMEVGGL